MMKLRHSHALLLGLSALFTLGGCHPQHSRPAGDGPAATTRASSLAFPPPLTRNSAVLLVTEGEESRAGAAALETLLSHFYLGCNTVASRDYISGSLTEYESVFYLAGHATDDDARAAIRADVVNYKGIFVWVGPGVEAMGEGFMSAVGVTPSPSSSSRAGVLPYAVSYHGKGSAETFSIPPVQGAKNTTLATARRGSGTRVFIAGADTRWYAAAGPSRASNRFWTACVWADALHDMLGISHDREPKRLLPLLREVPVWATATQAPEAVRPLLKASLPVSVMAWISNGKVPLGDRLNAVRGLRAAESLGATISLLTDHAADEREEFRAAWELGLHPLAWMGPSKGDRIFHLRLADQATALPVVCDGLLPAPLALSDAGALTAADRSRLEQLEVVRDGVAPVSFRLWASPATVQSFLKTQREQGWVLSDLRDLGARVQDTRRVLTSTQEIVTAMRGDKVRMVRYAPTWAEVDRKQVNIGETESAVAKAAPPTRGVVSVELLRDQPDRPFVRGVTLDPSAYGREKLSAAALAKQLAQRYAENGVNTVFVYAYHVKDGAIYPTRYREATISPWGEQDLLRRLLDACHARDIRVVAWMYSGRDRAMWNKHPEWRERTKDGKDYNPLRLHAAYFLCPRQEGVRDWYTGLVADLGKRYPDLDGIELCEPVVNWFGDQACHCEACSSGFAKTHPGEPVGGPVWRQYRAEGMTEFMLGCTKAIAGQGIDSYLMTLSDAWSNGAILTQQRQAEESGLDMNAILDSPYAPNWVNYEIIWQQWAALYGEQTFNYDWAEETAKRLARRTDGRARVLFHLELTDFGAQRMTPGKLTKTIARVAAAHPDGIDCYHSYALDQRRGWTGLKAAYGALP